MFEKSVDFRTVGKNPLEFVRAYNSQGRTSGVLGTSWQHNWERNLSLAAHCPGQTYACSITAIRSDGKQFDFYNYSSGTWTGDADVPLTITQSGSNYLLTDSNGTVETYTPTTSNLPATAYLQSVAYVDGYTQTLNYNGSNQLTSVTDNQSRALTFTYNGSGNLATMADPNGETFTYDYQPAFPTTTYPYTPNQLLSVIEPGSLSPMVTYVYGTGNFPTYLTGVIDELDDGFASWTYDTLGEATSSSLAGGAGLTTMTYNGNGTNTATFPLGEQVTYAFSDVEGAPKISSQSRAASGGIPAATMTYAYDSNGFLGTMTDYNGNETVTVNNSQGLPTSITEAYGTPQARTTTITWQTDSGLPGGIIALPSQIQTPRETVTYAYDTTFGTYDLLGRTQIDAATGNKLHTTYTYDTLGHRLTANGPRTDVSQITTYTYTTNGYLNTIKDPLGHVTTITSTNGRGQPLAYTDPNGTVTSLSYDSLGRVLTRTADAAGTPATTTFTYNAAGEITMLTQPDGTTLNYAYDTAHRLTTITDAAGDTIVYTLDALGDITQEQVKNSSGTLVKTQSRVYDEIGRLLEVIGASSQITTYAYDSDSNLTALKDASGNSTTQAYDALNRLVSVTDPYTHTTTNTYDSQNNLSNITDPRGLITTYTFDGFALQTAYTSPDTGLTTYSIDAAGNHVQEHDARGVQTNRSFDALNRITGQTYSSPYTGEDIYYTYDSTAGGNKGIGHLTSFSDESGRTTLTYDARGNVLTDSRTIDSLVFTTTYAYNLADRVTTITYPSGHQVHYGYDAEGRINAVTATISGTTYNLAGYANYEPFGPVAGVGFGSGMLTTYAYDQDFRLTTIATASGSLSAQNLSLAYNSVDDITSITDHLDSTRTQTFTYDDDYRLLTADGKYGYLTYTYDANGNRTSQDTSGTMATYTYPSISNLLSSISGSTARNFTYNATGNLTYDDRGGGLPVTFTYGGKNRNENSAVQGNGSTNYEYNGLGQRVFKSINGWIFIFNYDEQGHLIAESTSTGAMNHEYVWLYDKPIVQIEPSGSIYFLHPDHLNTVQKITDGTPTIVWDRIYQPFGKDYTITAPSLTSNLRLPGQYPDLEDGINNNVMRDIDPGLGRYLQADPFDLGNNLQQNPNQYAYASANTYSIVPSMVSQNANRQSSTDSDIILGTGFLPGQPFQTVPVSTMGSSTSSMNLHSYGNQNPLKFVDPTGQFGETTMCTVNNMIFELKQKMFPANDNPPPNPPNTCPFVRELPEAITTPGNRACIYQCDSGLRVKEQSSSFSCGPFIRPFEGVPYSPINPVR